MGRSTTTRRLLGAAVALGLGAVGCGSPVGSCALDPDPGGRWVISASPVHDDGGDDTIPRAATFTALLDVQPAQSAFSFGRYVRGTVSSDDPGFFGTLTIPALEKNDGSKTGSTLGCKMQINVPVASVVTDDNTDPGPLRLSLGGLVTARGQLTGDPALSAVILVEDPTMTPRRFAWTGVRQ